MIRNTYFTSYFPLISIILFSTSFGIYFEKIIIRKLQDIGVYKGMLEFFSENGIRLTIFFVLLLIFFMVFAALKLISDTVIQLSLLFFTKDEEGHSLHKMRMGSWIFIIASFLSVLLLASLKLLVILFVVASIGYFLFFIFRIGQSLSIINIIGLVFFNIFFWFSFVFSVAYVILKLYNSFVSSLPI